MEQKNRPGSPEGLPRHMCTVVLGGPCDVAGQPRHELQMHSADDFAVLMAELIVRHLGRSVADPVILDVDTLTGRADQIDAEEAHRRFAPACLKAHPPDPLGGLAKANSREN